MSKHVKGKRCVGGHCGICNSAYRRGGLNAPNPKDPQPPIVIADPVRSPPGKPRTVKSLFDPVEE